MRIIGIVLAVVLVLVIAGCGEQTQEAVNDTVDAVTGIDTIEKGGTASKDLAIARCKELYRQKFALGEDMSAEPCLSENIVTGWVCYVVHSSRTTEDDNPANQCEAYRDGRASHYVELDSSGQLIEAH